MNDYQAWVIENIEKLGYEYDFYCLESNGTTQSFKEWCVVAFNKAKEVTLALDL